MAATAAATGGASSWIRGFWNHPAGPKTIHFWAPTFKWGISIANIADMQRPADRISVPQQCAITATGVIWSRYSTQITPVNYNLLAVNLFMAVTGSYQLYRKFMYDQEVAAAAAASGAKAISTSSPSSGK